MTTKSAFRNRYAEAIKASPFSEEATTKSASLWDWTMESNIRIWDEIARERLEQYGKREWNYFAEHVMSEIQEYAKIMREEKAKLEEVKE
tara:strand:+ start:161 stop:430 length:270 start_codon:yes stop_codon:yes gene_type:complete